MKQQPTTPVRLTATFLSIFLFSLSAPAQSVDTVLTKRLFKAAGQAFQQGDFERNVVLTDSLAQAYADGGDYTGYAIFSMYNGWTHFNEFKDFAKAQYYGERALRTVDEKLNGQLPYLYDLYSLLSSIYGSTGNSEKGLEYGQQAIEAVKMLHQTGTFGDYVVHANAGTAYLELDRWSEALPYLLKAKEILYQIADKAGWDQRLYINAAQVHAHLAMCYLGLENSEKAMEEVMAGAPFPERSGSPEHFDFHEIYLALAEVNSQQGNLTEALGYFQKLENIYFSYFGARSVQMAQLYQKKAEHYFRQKDAATALRENTKALQVLGGKLLADSLTLDPQFADLLCQGCEPELYEQRIRLLFTLSEANPGRRDLLTACLATTEQAVQSLESIRQTILFREGSKQALFEQFQSIYKKGSLAAQQLYQLSGLSKHLKTAFTWSEKSKASILLEALEDARAEDFANLPAEVMAEERRLSLDMLKQEQLLEKALNEKETLKNTEIPTGNLFKARQKYERFLQELARDYPDYFAARHQAASASVADLQQAVRPGELLVSYMIHPEDQLLQIFTIDSEGLQLHTSTWSDKTEIAIEQTFQSLQRISIVQKKNRIAFIRQSNQLYQTLLQPIEQQLQRATRIIVIPEGPLAFLPFDVLLAKEEDLPFEKLDFLVKEKTVSYHYSGTVFLESVRKKVAPEREILAFAPVFSNEDETGEAATASRSFLDTSLVAIDRGRWQSLPGTEKEVQMIRQLFEDQSPEILLFDSANENNLKNALDRGFKYVHIATHSFANRQNPRFSGIACAKTEPNDAAEDGILHVNEVYNLDIRSDLVVLSSCESGLGTLAAGEGMLGLNRSFIYAGVPNVLYSLWKVDDARSSALMIRFYRELRSGKSYAESLRQAKLTMLEDPVTALPVYWSAFALIGR